MKKAIKTHHYLILILLEIRILKQMIKTTNVNILLNRVRLDQKEFKKRIVFSIILAGLLHISYLFYYLV